MCYESLLLDRHTYTQTTPHQNKIIASSIIAIASLFGHDEGSSSGILRVPLIADSWPQGSLVSSGISVYARVNTLRTPRRELLTARTRTSECTYSHVSALLYCDTVHHSWQCIVFTPSATVASWQSLRKSQDSVRSVQVFSSCFGALIPSPLDLSVSCLFRIVYQTMRYLINWINSIS